MNASFDQITQAALQYAAPLWLAGLGELVVQRSGVINIGIEGMMLCGALAAWAAAVVFNSAWMGLLGAVLTGVALAGAFALVVLTFDADQVVAGTAINLLAVGATGLGFKLCVVNGLTERRGSFFEPVQWSLPFHALDQFGLFYVILALAGGLQWMMHRTRFGIELHALGEHPAAATVAGIRVNARRFACVLFGGACAGLAGSYLSIMFIQQFNENMTAGRGFLALAMVIFGRWRPFGLLAGGAFFGYVYALSNQLEVSPVTWLPSPQWLQAAPYLLTLVVLAGLAGKTRAPAALGQPLERV